MNSQDLYRTKLCNSVKQGFACRFGVHCTYAHQESELQPILSTPYQPRPTNSQPNPAHSVPTLGPNFQPNMHGVQTQQPCVYYAVVNTPPPPQQVVQVPMQVQYSQAICYYVYPNQI